jgi:mono/diheme cytochrome c family protein
MNGKALAVMMERTMRDKLVFVLLWFIGGGAVSFAGAAEQHMIQSRVPPDKLAEARALVSPVQNSPEMFAKGKSLYEGKGTCVNCHGQSGAGDGPLSASLNPAPRNFRHHGFWRHRTEGEIFWVIKYGSPGTSMIGFGSVLTEEEIWALIQYEQSFAGEHGPRRGMGPRGGRDRMGPGGAECCADQDSKP